MHTPQISQKHDDDHQASLAAMRASVQERVDMERQRLGTRLAAVEAEAARLQRACEEAGLAAQQTLAFERAEVGLGE